MYVAYTTSVQIIYIIIPIKKINSITYNRHKLHFPHNNYTSMNGGVVYRYKLMNEKYNLEKNRNTVHIQ